MPEGCAAVSWIVEYSVVHLQAIFTIYFIPHPYFYAIYIFYGFKRENYQTDEL